LYESRREVLANEQVTIDGKEYPLEDLSDVVKQQQCSRLLVLPMPVLQKVS